MMISDNVIDAWGHFKSIFMGIINNIALIKQVRIKQRTEGWIHTEILKSIKDTDEAFREFKKFKTGDKYSIFKELRNKTQNLKGIVSSKIYDKRDDFNFEIVNFPFFYGDVPRSSSYGVYISQLIRFASVCSNVDDFKNRNLFLTAKLLKQDIIKFEKHFLNSTTDTQS